MTIRCGQSSTLGILKVMRLNVKVTDNLFGEGIGLLVTVGCRRPCYFSTEIK